MDPWPTSYWGSYTFQQIPKDFALGKTVGESYAYGITEIGPKYIFEEDEEQIWWWDDAENVVLFADPDLRIWIPNTDYDDQKRNHWERDDFQALRFDLETNIEGHMPFKVSSYPHQKTINFLLQYLLIIIIVAIFAILLISFYIRKTNKRKSK
jgi:hypothetical protein